MSDQNNIPWYQSRIIWLQIIGAVAALGGSLGYELTPADQQQLVEVLISLVTVGTTMSTIYHRITKPCPPITNKGEQP